MVKSKLTDHAAEYERAAQRHSKKKEFVFALYIAGMSPNSRAAVRTILRLCHDSLDGKWDLQVIDLYQQPERAARDQIIAVPTLVRKLPRPVRKFIGDLADTSQVLAGLV